MPFDNTRLDELAPVDFGVVNTSLEDKTDSYKTFESGINIGRFAKLDTNSIDNLDGSASPIIAGVVVREETNAIQSGDTYVNTGDAAIQQISVLSWGLVTVDVVTGDTPAKFGNVYAVNASGSGANFGKATTTATNNVQVTGYFNREIKTNVWEVFVRR